MTRTSKQVLSNYSSWQLFSEWYGRFETPILYAALCATWCWVFIKALS